MGELPELDWGDYREIVVLTGAGVSVASGLRPYRGPGGLWEEAGLAERATVEALREDPAQTWALFGALRPQALAAQPNPAHLALALLEAQLAGRASFTLLTQNIDGLHQRAGSRSVVELHGSAFRTRCLDPACALAPFADTATHADGVPRCPRCQGTLRPDVVLFGEALDVDVQWQVKQALRDCDLFLAVGTSGSVAPASNYARSADYAGARTLLVNLEPLDPPNPYFQEQVLGPAEVVLPRLVREAGR